MKCNYYNWAVTVSFMHIMHNMVLKTIYRNLAYVCFSIGCQREVEAILYYYVYIRCTKFYLIKYATHVIISDKYGIFLLILLPS